MLNPTDYEIEGDIHTHTYLGHYPIVILIEQRQKKPQVKAAHRSSSSEIFCDIEGKTETLNDNCHNLCGKVCFVAAQSCVGVVSIRQGSIPVGCQLSACQPYVLHNEQNVWMRSF